MDENLEVVVIEQVWDFVIDFIVEMMDFYGIICSVGILYGMMYMRDEMIFDEMCEEL